jgi:hypothetical protein
MLSEVTFPRFDVGELFVADISRQNERHERTRGCQAHGEKNSSLSNPSSPMPIMSRRVQHRGNRQPPFCLVHFVDHAKRKSLRHPPSNIFNRMPLTAKQRVVGQRIPHADDLLDKIRTEPRLTLLIPGRRFGHVPLDLRSDLNPPTHRQWRPRKRALISSNESAEEGSWRWAANRSSTSASSSAERPASSRSNARRMRICRSATERAANSARTSGKLMGEQIAQRPGGVMPVAQNSFPTST